MLRITITADDGSYPRTRKYQIHKPLIVSKSPYFAALKNFEEGQHNHVTVRGINHNAFRQILSWVYSGNFRKKEIDDVEVLLKTWVAADRFMMEMCKNMAMDALREHFEPNIMTMSTVILVKGFGYSEESRLVEFVMDQYVWDCIDQNHNDHDLADWPAVFNKLGRHTSDELMRKLLVQSRGWRRFAEGDGEQPIPPASLGGCRYHDHTVSNDCS